MNHLGLKLKVVRNTWHAMNVIMMHHYPIFITSRESGFCSCRCMQSKTAWLSTSISSKSAGINSARALLLRV